MTWLYFSRRSHLTVSTAVVSITTGVSVLPDGINLLNVKQLEEASGSSEIFPIIMAAIVKAVDEHGDLMRMAIASPGNDFRLGACEAPPAIISTYLGESMTHYLQTYMSSGEAEYSPQSNQVCPAEGMAPVSIPAEDRNRTSPFPMEDTASSSVPWARVRM